MSFYLLSSLCISVLPLSQVINEDCNGLLEKAQRGDFSTGMPRQGQVNILVFEYQAGPGEYESFSDVGEIRVYFASKILTPYRMH